MTTSSSSYEGAVSALLSPLHQATTPHELRAAALRRTSTLQDMQVYLHRLGLNLNDYGENVDADIMNNTMCNQDNHPISDKINDTFNNDRNDSSSKKIFEHNNNSCIESDNNCNNYHIPKLIFHITGTKGKGSTLSFCESLLRNAYGLNTGLFTSPHLVDIRERIRINGVPISKAVFGTVYWRVRHKLEQFHDDDDDDRMHQQNSDVEGNQPILLPPLPTLPGYFRMLTLMALYTFCHNEIRTKMSSKIDVILLEVGMGGRYDATNVFEPVLSPPNPMAYLASINHSHGPTRTSLHALASATKTTTTTTTAPIALKNYKCNNQRTLVRGVTLIDFDHTRVLGSTLSQIAWEKGGIYVRNKLHNIGMDDGGYDRFVTEQGISSCSAAATSITGEDASTNNDNCFHPHLLQTTAATTITAVAAATTTKTTSTVHPFVFVNGNNHASEVLPVLQRIATCNGSQLRVIHDSSIERIPVIGLEGDHQRSNAALALAMCQYAINQLQRTSTNPSTMQLHNALAKTFWPGRCHTVPYPILPTTASKLERWHRHTTLRMNLRCDGAHTPLSIRACVNWFRNVISTSHHQNNDSVNANSYAQRKFLIFNCGHERNPIPLIYCLCTSNIMFQEVYFCHADFERPSAVPKQIEKAWTIEPLASDDRDTKDAIESPTTANVTFESICHELQNRNISIHQTILSMFSESTTTSWQETLSNVWKVIDMYYRRLEKDTSTAGDGNAVTESDCLPKVIIGLDVKDALASIQKGVATSMTMDDSKNSDEQSVDSEKNVVIEVCVTGSLYIVGSALAAAGWEEKQDTN